MKRRSAALALLCLTLNTFGVAQEPKLIVAISLDQFRYDYIARFRQHFGKGGFNYLLQNGANFSNASFKHATNTTGPGHASVLSGSYGSTNGIIANDWYDRARQSSMYCVNDDSVKIVGGKGSGKSPRNFIGSTLGDELRLRNGYTSKVISVSNKDRAAILMAGKNPTGVYWQMDSVFVTSTYYRNDLPDWVKGFNESRFIGKFFGATWGKKLPEASYGLLDADDAPYEQAKDGMSRTFPHRIFGTDTSRITPSYYWALNRSPFGAQVLSEFAKRAVEAEQLGRRGVTDMLCVSFSSTDIVGHAYGPHSHEVMDMALRMDDILADLFSYLDKKIGLKQCVIVLTADHGVAPIPEFILSHNRNADAGRIALDRIWKISWEILHRNFDTSSTGLKWIKSIVANNMYFDRPTFDAYPALTIESVARLLADSLRSLPWFAASYSAGELLQPGATAPIEAKMKRSFHPSRSGDVVYALKPYWTEGDYPSGAAHGEPYDYDAHVPVIIVGKGIRPGTYATEASPIDIAPTLSALLGIEFPAGCEGRVLTEAFK